MVHFFDVDVAKEYGIECAVIFQNIGFWVQHNRENGLNDYDGSFWTYNSAKAFEHSFPYMSYQKIGRALMKLEEVGLIKSGNYNKSKFDRTKWYTLTEDGYRVFRNENSHLSNLINGDITGDKPIPDINTDSKPNINIYRENNDSIPQDDISSIKGLRGHDLQVAADNGFATDNDLLNAYIDFYKMRKSIKKPLTDRAVVMLKNQLDKLANGDIQMMIDILNQSSFNCWQGVFPLKCNVKYSQSQKAVNGDTGSYDAYGNMRQ